MCLLTKTNRTRLLKKDIIAYKTVWQRDTGTVVSLYHKWEYKMGKVYKKEFKKPRYSKVIAKYVWEGEGFHSYLNLRYAMELLHEFNMNGAVIVECIIPRGSLTCTGIDGQEIISSDIVITKLLKVD